MTNEMEDRALPFPAYFPAESGSGRLGPLNYTGVNRRLRCFVVVDAGPTDVPLQPFHLTGRKK